MGFINDPKAESLLNRSQAPVPLGDCPRGGTLPPLEPKQKSPKTNNEL